MKKYKQKALRLVSNFLTIIVTVVALVMLYNFIQLKILHKPYVNVFGYAVFEVASGSMAPVIDEKDLIIVKITKNVELDDVVTFYKDNTYITHRIINMQGDFFITRGEANNTNDSPVAKNAVLGKVVYTIPEFGTWKSVLLNPKVLISIVFTIILFNYALFSGNKKKPKCDDFGIYNKGIIKEYGEPNE